MATHSNHETKWADTLTIKHCTRLAKLVIKMLTAAYRSELLHLC